MGNRSYQLTSAGQSANLLLGIQLFIQIYRCTFVPMKNELFPDHAMCLLFIQCYYFYRPNTQGMVLLILFHVLHQAELY